MIQAQPPSHMRGPATSKDPHATVLVIFFFWRLKVFWRRIVDKRGEFSFLVRLMKMIVDISHGCSQVRFAFHCRVSISTMRVGEGSGAGCRGPDLDALLWFVVRNFHFSDSHTMGCALIISPRIKLSWWWQGLSKWARHFPWKLILAPTHLPGLSSISAGSWRRFPQLWPQIYGPNGQKSLPEQ